jgi:hypothetical protein
MKLEITHETCQYGSIPYLYLIVTSDCTGRQSRGCIGLVTDLRKSNALLVLLHTLMCTANIHKNRIGYPSSYVEIRRIMGLTQ